MKDDATNEPINICIHCGKEVIGYLDEPDQEFVCDECKVKRRI